MHARPLPFLLPLLLVMISTAASAQAPTTPGSAKQLFSTPLGVNAATLDTVRGGFAYSDNLLVTLGIDRLVKINGNVVEQSTLQFGDVGKLANGTAALGKDNVPGARLIQNGPSGQLISSLPAGAMGGAVIQNTLSDQLISNQTTIRASVNNAGVLQTMHFNATLNQALNDAVSAK